MTTVAGSGAAGYVDAKGPAASFNYPHGVSIDTLSNIYVADYSNHRIRKIDKDGNVTTLAGSGFPGFADGSGTNAAFTYPHDVAVDSAYNCYVADCRNHRYATGQRSLCLRCCLCLLRFFSNHTSGCLYLCVCLLLCVAVFVKSQVKVW